MFRYRNRSTGQVVEREVRDLRLDRLAYRWELLDRAVEAPDEQPPPEPPASQSPGELSDDEAPGDDPGPPAKRAPRAAWEAYAAQQGASADEIAGMTRVELIERFDVDD